MKIIIIISLIFIQCQILIGQETGIYTFDNKLYGKLKNGLPKKDTIVEFKKNGILLGKGALAVSERGVSNLKVGYWKEYSEDGTLKMEGNYNLSSYINCGVGGAFSDFYFYRTGVWKIYDKYGQIKYELTFDPTELQIDTSCEGGDKLIFGIVKDIPLKYWGYLTSDKIFELQRTQTEDDYAIEIWTPLNGTIFIETKIKNTQ